MDRNVTIKGNCYTRAIGNLRPTRLLAVTRWARCCWRRAPRGGYALPHSRIMIHQLSGGFEGQATDIEIQAREALRLREILNNILTSHSGQPLKRIEKDTDRDFFMHAAQAVEYGLIDEVIANRPGNAGGDHPKPHANAVAARFFIDPRGAAPLSRL